MLAEPEVAERWLGTNALERVVDELYDADEHVPFAILAGDEVIGYIQYSEETDADYRHAGIDMFLGTAWHGRGLGRDALRALVASPDPGPRPPPDHDRSRGLERACDPRLPGRRASAMSA